MDEVAEFRGSTKQAIVDIMGRMDRMENKLDKVIAANDISRGQTHIISFVISAGISIIGAFINSMRK